MRMFFRIIMFGLAFALTSVSQPSASGGQEPPRQNAAWEGQVTTVDGVRIVRNTARPIYSGAFLDLREDLVIGQAEERDGNALFNEIRGPRNVVADDDGRIYVLDVKDCQVKVFDREGRAIRSFARRGQAPGEFQGPYRISLTPADEIAVEELLTRSLTFFSHDGAYLRRVSLAELGIADVEIDPSGGLIGIAVAQEDAFPDRLELFGPDLRHLRLLESRTRPRREEDKWNPFGPGSNRFCLIPGNRVLTGSSDNPELRVIDTHGKLEWRILTNFRPVPVSKKDIEERLKGQKFLGGPPPPLGVPKHHLPYLRFFPDDEGRLYIETWEKTPDRRGRFFEILDPEGRYLGRQAWNFQPHCIRKGKLYSVEEDNEGCLYVKRYDMSWKPIFSPAP